MYASKGPGKIRAEGLASFWCACLLGLEGNPLALEDTVSGGLLTPRIFCTSEQRGNAVSDRGGCCLLLSLGCSCTRVKGWVGCAGQKVLSSQG